jgi:hypothetical protein
MNDNETTSPPETIPGREPRVRRLLSNRRSRWIVAAGLMLSAVGLSVGLVTSASTPATTSAGTAGHLAPGSGVAGGLGSGIGASSARSGPAAGGAAGTVKSVSGSGFTMSTASDQEVTVDEASSTTYKRGTNSTSASAVATGESVLVLGTTNSTTITATEVIVDYTSTSSASSAKVVPFQRGAPTTSKQVGQIPANWSPGQGTIINGTAANEATEAALAAYPGGIVDRVVLLSNGEYNVHYIGVNWPHHVFESASFKVIGAL